MIGPDWLLGSPAATQDTRWTRAGFGYSSYVADGSCSAAADCSTPTRGQATPANAGGA